MNAPYLQVMVAVMTTSAETPPMVTVMVVSMMVVMSMLFSLSLHQKASGLSPLGPTRVLSVLPIQLVTEEITRHERSADK